ncbi:hypothetical protein J31TS4_45530 [Paenibacillus sp. J31TS4]|uniref:ABC transporter permease n=1 Tax=Paenibacillus sp. J31TS4 TaxID=2807195 RepID=UPI001B15EB31|nr:ABC-2 family transporter protein [Paenibacillus sp. J31TS4]GIP41273.1 hypothetical protein J31TS4_45530 [Paenibacillus sp. J31TS4]
MLTEANQSRLLPPAERPVLARATALARFVWTCWKLNLAGAMEFRMSFLLTAGMMMVNNTVWMFFWAVYFHRFPIVNGWGLEDVMMMWAVSTTGFGLSATLFGNCYRIAGLVASGQLDVYAAQPKPVLLHVLITRMSVSAIGDVLYGLLLYAIFGEHTLLGACKFIAALLLATAIFVFYNTLVQSLAFYIGNAEGLGLQMFNIVLTFSTYPTDIFRGFSKLLLFTVVPAAFISYLPIGLLRETNGLFLAGALLMALALAAGGTLLFYRGLARYTSGNQIGLRM